VDRQTNRNVWCVLVCVQKQAPQNIPEYFNGQLSRASNTLTGLVPAQTAPLGMLGHSQPTTLTPDGSSFIIITFRVISNYITQS